MSGLTVGYLSIDKLDLEIKQSIGTLEEKKCHHYLLVTLLLSNAFAMEALPIYLDAIVPSFWAIIISVTAVLFFGEVIPQAVCTGPSQLIIARRLAPLIKFLMFSLGLVCYPISKVLDCVLGEHDITRFKNDQLKTLVQMHSKKALQELQIVQNENMGLSNLQTNIIAGAFDLRNTTIDQLITPYERVFSLSIDTILDKEVIDLIKLKGYSRIPVYYGEDHSFILGLLIVKSLIGLNVESPLSLRELSMKGQCLIKTPIYASPSATVGQMLNIFKEGSAHLAVVCQDPERLVDEANDLLEAIKQGRDQQVSVTSHQILGITTLEKIIEQIISMPILDEKDIEKRLRNPSGQFSMTIQDESNRDMQEMNELLNETNQNFISKENQKIFNAKFTQLFAQKLESQVKEDITQLGKRVSSLYEGDRDYKNIGMDPKFSQSLLDRDI
ncbi:UNKNOWN [Stylonychia lemnae]|uniref:CNNM transmembrane domain-containing protein n=1 Tax=Stylonychia lemnae TaxID=5949 RepID=A0A078AJ65_STYLE|nr:UNKNOWN [Stylonychia lemnae]|eukprot:CDW80843.1 UNKNOWN [Stylonychia lemnae]